MERRRPARPPVPRGDAIRVLGRVERFRDRLQLEVRSLEPSETDPSSLVPEARRDVEELDGFFDFLASEISHAGLKTLVGRFASDAEFRARLRLLPATVEGHHAWAGGLLEHTISVATLCREADSCTRACAPISWSQPHS